MPAATYMSLTVSACAAWGEARSTAADAANPTRPRCGTRWACSSSVALDTGEARAALGSTRCRRDVLAAATGRRDAEYASAVMRSPRLEDCPRWQIYLASNWWFRAGAVAHSLRVAPFTMDQKTRDRRRNRLYGLAFTLTSLVAGTGASHRPAFTPRRPTTRASPPPTCFILTRFISTYLTSIVRPAQCTDGPRFDATSSRRAA